MKRIVSMLIAILMIINSALAYTRTVRALGIGMVITSEKGTEVTLTPTNEEIKGWEVEEGDIEIVDNKFTMPEGNVRIKATEEEKYLFKLIFPYFTKEENMAVGDPISVQALTENEEYIFESWTATGITLTAEQQVSPSITFTMPANAVTLVANYEEVVAPTLATTNGAWYTQGGTSIAKTSITSIEMMPTYTPGTVVESWDASSGQAGTITAYVEDDGSGNGTYKVTLAGNGADKMLAEASCQSTFNGFSSVTNLAGLNMLHTSNVTNMGSMFSGCNGLTSIDVSEFDTSNVTIMYCMFSDCNGLTSIDVSGFDISNVTNIAEIFDGCSSLTSLDVSGFNTSNIKSMWRMFRNCSSLTSLDVSGFNTSNVTNMASMFERCRGLMTIDISGFDTSNVTNMSYMFNECSGLTTLDVSGFNTSNVTNMDWIFRGCSSLTSVDVSGFDTSNVTNMGSMFSGCNGLTSIDVSGFDTSNVTSMIQMFYGCSSLTSLDVSGFDTSNVTNMAQMFDICSALTSVDVSGFDTSNVTNMGSMFNECSGLTSVDVSGFNTSNVTNMDWIFRGCNGLTSIDVSGFDTSNVTSMREMFNGCSSLTSLDVSGFDTSNVTNMSYMFSGMSNLQEIILGVNFSFTGNGTAANCVLPTPSSAYIIGADGNWYNSAGTAFAPTDVPNNVADAYYAASSLVPDPWNAPTLGEGLTPVNWNGTTWVTTDEANWDYNYEIATAGHNTVAGDGTGKWANAQTADGSLYVWIPRYTYKITSGEHASGNSWSSVDSPGTNKIEVKFSNGTTDDTTDSYKKHPAFTFGTAELEGIWVAKYEASRNDATSDGEGTGTTVSSKPNVISWRYISVSDAYNYSYNVNRALDSHLMRNSEWGAVAYLTNAIGKIPYTNNSATYITGNAGGSQDATWVDGVTNAWNTVGGVKASSTHNVYGIYDLSDGAWEYVSAYLESVSNSYIGSLVSNKDTKYVEVYTANADGIAYTSTVTGDAIYETSGDWGNNNPSTGSVNASWDGDYSDATDSNSIVFLRGTSGIFGFFSHDGGGEFSTYGFRPVLAIP